MCFFRHIGHDTVMGIFQFCVKSDHVVFFILFFVCSFRCEDHPIGMPIFSLRVKMDQISEPDWLINQNQEFLDWKIF
jgi:hypothetical protein